MKAGKMAPKRLRFGIGCGGYLANMLNFGRTGLQSIVSIAFVDDITNIADLNAHGGAPFYT